MKLLATELQVARVRVGANMHPTQVRYTGDHALAADEVPQTFVVVLFGHQVVEPVKRCLVLPTQ